jgi:glycosyltransferase involved in cell wall biosynthesis
MKASLIIPCYNEAENLPLLLERCWEIAKRPDCEVVLVDNGSYDKTRDLLPKLLRDYPGVRSIRLEKNQGYGFGILSGLKAAQGGILGWTHADMQADPQDFLRGLSAFEQHGSHIFVKGRRFGRPLSDVTFTVGMSLFETMLLGKLLWDINAQPTMFTREVFESWKEPPHDFSIDLFAYYAALKSKLTVHRFPVRFGERANGVSHWNLNWASKRKFILRTIEYSINLRSKI